MVSLSSHLRAVRAEFSYMLQAWQSGNGEGEMTAKPNFDETKGREFTQKVMGDLSGAMATLMCILGDRLNLFKELATNGPATS